MAAIAVATGIAMVMMARHPDSSRRPARHRGGSRSGSLLPPFRVPPSADTPQWLRWAATGGRVLVLTTGIGVVVALIVVGAVALI